MPRLALAALALILIGSGIAEAQDYAIHGYIVAPSKKHIESFEAVLTTRDAEYVISRAIVGAFGEYMFKNVPSGYFDILVRLPGFRESRTPLQAGDPEKITADSLQFISMNVILIPDSDDTVIGDSESAYRNAIVDEYGKGLDEFGRKHHELAAMHLENVVREVPEFSDARVNLGLVYQELSRRDEAEKQFKAAIALSGDSARPFLALGRMYLEDADLEIRSGSNPEAVRPRLAQARESLTQALMLDPKSAAALYHLGAVDYRTASYGTAENELKRALELDPKLSPARIMLVNVFVKQEMWQDALDSADIFLIEFPGSPFRSDVNATRSGVMRKLRSPSSN